MKIVKRIKPKFVIFTSVKNRCMLHGRVFVMNRLVFAGLTRLLAEGRDYDELALAWKRWRDVSRGEMKDLYAEFVELSNEGVRGKWKIVIWKAQGVQ